MADDLDQGWHPKLLTADQVAEIEQRWPRVEPYQVDRVAEGAVCDLDHSQPRGASRRRLQSLHKRTRDLRYELRAALNADPHIKDAIVGAEYFGSKSARATETLYSLNARLDGLKDFEKLLASAVNRLPVSSATKWPEKHAIDGLAQIIEDAGYPANQSKDSPLTELVVMVFQAIAPFQKSKRRGAPESVVEHWLKEKSRSK